MMLRTVFFWTLLLCSSFGVSVTASIEEMDVDALVERALEEFSIPGAAVGVIVEGKVVLAKGYGLRNREQKLSTSVKTLFPIGSCTKAFTTLALGQLVEEGVVSWDAPVKTYLPEFRLWNRYAAENLTVRDLVAHRSGLARHDLFWYGSSLNRYELFQRLEYLQPLCDLREKFQYNNLMYLVAGLVIERVTGNTWEEVIQTRIFDPLGMARANLSVETLQQQSDFSNPHIEVEGEIQTIPFRNIDAIGSAGSINANLEEMLTWIQFQLSDGCELIQEETLKEMHTSHIPLSSYYTEPEFPIGYGLGWMIKFYRGHYLVEHGGGIDGFISLVCFLPKEKVGIVLLTNSMSGGGYFVSSVSRTLLDHILDKEPHSWLEEMSALKNQARPIDEGSSEVFPSSYPVEAYVGSYSHPGYGSLEIYHVEGSLFARYNTISLPLAHVSEETFKVENPLSVYHRMPFTFTAGATKLRVPLEPTVDPIVFEKSSTNA